MPGRIPDEMLGLASQLAAHRGLEVVHHEGDFLRDGAFVADALSIGNFEFIADAVGGVSFGLWYNVQEGEPTSGSGLVSTEFGDADGGISFQINSDGATIILTISGDTAESVAVPGIAAGWNYFGFTRTGTSVQFVANGAPIGSPVTVTSSAGTGNEIIGLVDGGGRFDQPMFAQVAYTADEWAYIYNGGDGRAYSAWEISGAAATGIGHINHLTMGCG
jgi:hypothetical protein